MERVKVKPKGKEEWRRLLKTTAREMWTTATTRWSGEHAGLKET